jgi:hypothetical protein
MPDPFTTFGLLVSLFAFLRSEIGGRTSKDELLKALEDQNVIQKYLEWLRRKDQVNLLQELQQVKDQLINQHEDIVPMLSILAGQIQATSHDLGQRIEELNRQIIVPDLFPTPLETRVALPITLQGRDAEVKLLTAASSDILVSGQPGSGKTFLLQEVARIVNGRFLLTSDPDKATQAVLAFKPSVNQDNLSLFQGRFKVKGGFLAKHRPKHLCSKKAPQPVHGAAYLGLKLCR